MPDIAIETNDLSKIYRLGDIGTGTLSHDLNRIWARLRGKEDPYLPVVHENIKNAEGENDYIWAVKDINIQVRKGDIVGVIGKNGAGKSTLLKLMSKITAPTQGLIKINGRVGSLLEVGTGMHPEMTAVENIFLNGAILGMNKYEIDQNIENILEFSGLHKYAQTPIKRFSSGMRVRLGFAVAAFLESEILIIDEVLAVGDLEFQKKAVGKLNEVTGNSDRTVLFVSHNLELVSQICNRCILIENGVVQLDGDTEDVLEEYVRRINDHVQKPFDFSVKRQGTGDIRVSNMRLMNEKDEECREFDIGSKIKIELGYSLNEPASRVRVVYNIYDEMNNVLVRLDTDVTESEELRLQQDGRIICQTDAINLKPARYYINVVIFSHGVIQDRLIKPVYFDIKQSDFFGNGRYFRQNLPMKMLVQHHWEVS